MSNSSKPVAQFQSYARFSGIAIQMGAIIAIGTFGGLKLDSIFNLSPLFTLLGSLGSIAISLYLVINKLTTVKNKKDAKSTN